MTTIRQHSLLRFCLGLLIASLAMTSFAAKKPNAAKSKAATAKVVKEVSCQRLLLKILAQARFRESLSSGRI